MVTESTAPAVELVMQTLQRFTAYFARLAGMSLRARVWRAWVLAN
jgi:hypothetical protein